MPYSKQTPSNLVAILLNVGIVIFILLSCKKEIAHNFKQDDQTVNKLFPIASIRDMEVKLIAERAKEQNKQLNFAPNFVKEKGLILWNDAIISASAEGTLFLIPFALEGKQDINGFLLSQKSNAGKISFTIYAKDSLLRYGFKERTSKLNAIQVQSLINYFNVKLFNKKDFSILDRRQILSNNNNQQLPSNIKKNQLKGRVKINESNLNNRSYCFNYFEEIEVWWNPNGDECNCDGDEYYLYSIYESETFCYDTYDEYIEFGDWTGGAGITTVVWEDPLPSLEEMITYLRLPLNINWAEEAWLGQNEMRTREIYLYLLQDNNSERTEALMLHLDYLTGVQAYSDFVNTYRIANPEIDFPMWWEDEIWIENNLSSLTNNSLFINNERPILFDYRNTLASPAVDLQKMINCFNNLPDAGATYKITLSTDLPNNSDPNALTNNFSPGHAFITMTKTNGGQSVSQSFGFYPKKGLNSIFSTAVPSKIVNDGTHEFNASITMNLSHVDFNGTLSQAVINANSLKYDLDDYNCTDFALNLFNSNRLLYQQVIVGDWVTYTTVPSGLPIVTDYGTTPNALYKKLVEIKASDPLEAANINIGTFNAPISAGECP